MMTEAFTTDDTRWQACLERNAAADGQFVALVRTTGIFCRPVCPARPLRRNVHFTDTVISALALGYRACKRCKPQG